jgi:hypothetical protein
MTRKADPEGDALAADWERCKRVGECFGCGRTETVPCGQALCDECAEEARILAAEFVRYELEDER